MHVQGRVLKKLSLQIVVVYMWQWIGVELSNCMCGELVVPTSANGAVSLDDGNYRCCPI